MNIIKDRRLICWNCLGNCHVTRPIAEICNLASMEKIDEINYKYSDLITIGNAFHVAHVGNNVIISRTHFTCDKHQRLSIKMESILKRIASMTTVRLSFTIKNEVRFIANNPADQEYLDKLYVASKFVE